MLRKMATFEKGCERHVKIRDLCHFFNGPLKMRLKTEEYARICALNVLILLGAFYSIQSLTFLNDRQPNTFLIYGV